MVVTSVLRAGALLIALLSLPSRAEQVQLQDRSCTIDVPFPLHNEHVSWSGGCAKGLAQGYGRMASSNGTVLVGEFREGYPQHAQGRVNVPGARDRRVALNATYVDGKGTFSALHKMPQEVQRYAFTISSLLRQHIVFPDRIIENPRAEIEVVTAADGRIISERVVVPSGVQRWDEAVVRAVRKVERLPMDVDGTVPERLHLVFRPH